MGDSESGRTPVRAAGARRRARALLAALCLLAVPAALAGVASLTFSPAALREAMIAEIRKATGLAALAQGRAVLVVLPQPHVNVEAVSFADPAGALRVEAQELKAYLRVGALLRGRLEVASATLVRPDIHVDLSARGAPVVGAPDSSLARALAAPAATPQAHADEARLGALTIVEGRAAVVAASGTESVLERIDATLDWRRPGDPARLAGSAAFRGYAAEFSVVVDRPADLLRGASSNVNLSLDGPRLSLSGQGEAAFAPKPQFSGRLAASAASLRKLAEAGGYFVALPAPLEDFSLTADVNLTTPAASFSNLRLRLDGNEYEGALAVLTEEERPALAGTLAAGRVSLRPFFARLAPLVSREGQWTREPFELDEHDLADLDLRISASRLALPGLDLKDAAVSLMKRGPRLDVGLIEAGVGQGTIKGRASFVKTEAGLEARVSAALNGVDAAALQPSGGEPRRLSGAAVASASAQGTGRSMAELMRSLEGSAQASLAQGEILGLNLAAGLRSVEGRPLSLAQDIRYGSTSFESAGFGLKIAHGVAQIVDGRLDGRSFELAFAGRIDLGERALDAQATAQSTAKPADASDRTPRRFSFEVSGPFDDLVLTPDAQSLIRRSDAAAPLFGRGVKPAPAN